MDSGLVDIILSLAGDQPVAVAVGSVALLLIPIPFLGRRAKVKRRRAREPKAHPAPPAAEMNAAAQDEDAPITIMDPPSQGSIEVTEVDPLAEVAVYLEFGYFGQAAQTLRWYVDGAGRDNLAALRKLLQIYHKLGQIEDYADILERLCEAGLDRRVVQQAILAGLTVDRDNLRLRVLAESQLKLGPTKLGEMLAPSQAAVPPPPKPSPKPETPPAKPAAPKAPPSAKGEKTPALRPALPLVEGEALLTPLSAEEKAVLHIFGNPAQAARLHLAVRDLDAAVPTLKRAIALQPNVLANFTELLKIFHIRRQIDDYARTLWHLYAVLKDSGHALRERLLGTGFTLGEHPLLEALAQAKDGKQVEAVGRRFGLLQADAPPARKRLLVQVEQQLAPVLTLKVEDSCDALKEADAYLEFGQIEQALNALETAVLKNPMEVRLYPPLLDLYDRMDDLPRFSTLAAKIKRLVQRPPEEVVPMMLNLYQRLQQRKQKAAA